VIRRAEKIAVRVGLARVMHRLPGTLPFADFSGLIASFRAEGLMVLLVDHNVTFALPHADRVYVIEHARIVWEGDPGRFAAEAGTGYL
jgi:ABC-type lipopolysaccharide export system ATPase subunit